MLVRATLDRQSDFSHVGAKEFEAEIPASDNRVGAIVQAFDQATTKVVGDLVAWVDQEGGSCSGRGSVAAARRTLTPSRRTRWS